MYYISLTYLSYDWELVSLNPLKVFHPLPQLISPLANISLLSVLISVLFVSLVGSIYFANK